MPVINPIHQQLNQYLSTFLTDQGIEIPTGTRLSYGIAEHTEDGELRFVVEAPHSQTPYIAQQLNTPTREQLIDCFVALEQHCARQQAEVAQKTGTGLYKQSFAMRYDGTDWQMDTQLYQVQL
ncbi:MAG: hypothetical protein OIF57_00580 [Marinobacterium sp.]|nr:hypothetical protein [Marinobacterium sp.]